MPIVRLYRTTCSAPFRGLAKATFPKLDLNPIYWRFFQYLLFGTFFDEDTDRLIISQAIIAEIEGKSPQLKNYCAENFLHSFQVDVMSPETFQWGKWRESKCRQVIKCEYPPEFAAALEDEWNKVNNDQGRVYFADGSQFSRAKQRAERSERKNVALATHIDAPCEAAKEVLEYMNNLPSNLFSRVLQYIPQALAIVDALPKKRAREMQRKYLKRIADQPQPFYKPSKKGNTDRLFGFDGCITNLQKDVRRALTVEWYEADLKSSQLAICAALWQVRDVQAFLAGGGSIWEHLFASIEIEYGDREGLKSALKEAVYSTCYGMKQSAIKGSLTKAFKARGIDRKGQKFADSPLIKEMLAARETAMERIRAGRGALTCFGKQLSTDNFEPRQILAQVAQAVELKLIHPVIRLAKETDEFRIVLWLHDGFAAHITRRVDMWKQRISEIVDREIAEMNIATKLEWL